MTFFSAQSLRHSVNEFSGNESKLYGDSYGTVRGETTKVESDRNRNSSSRRDRASYSLSQREVKQEKMQERDTGDLSFCSPWCDFKLSDNKKPKIGEKENVVA